TSTQTTNESLTTTNDLTETSSSSVSSSQFSTESTTTKSTTTAIGWSYFILTFPIFLIPLQRQRKKNK
ncbi:MAG: hypothetical protein ACXABI_02200, partial [Candidatus Hodarchaeales archaeon]